MKYDSDSDTQSLKKRRLWMIPILMNSPRIVNHRAKNETRFWFWKTTITNKQMKNDTNPRNNKQKNQENWTPVIMKDKDGE